jgi:hypothetical protein
MTTESDLPTKQPYKPQGILPVRASWRYRPDGSYYKGTKDLQYDAKYYQNNLKGRRHICDVCGANIAYTYKSRHMKRIYCIEAKERKVLEPTPAPEPKREPEYAYSEFD